MLFLVMFMTAQLSLCLVTDRRPVRQSFFLASHEVRRKRACEVVAVGAEPLAQEEQQAGVLALIRAFLLNLVWVVVQQCQKCCHREV